MLMKCEGNIMWYSIELASGPMQILLLVAR